MNFLRDLSVGKKLAASAGIAMALLAVLVVLVMRQTNEAAQAQAAQRRATDAQAASLGLAREVLVASNAWRGILAWQTPAAVESEKQTLLAASREAQGRVEDLRRIVGQGAMQGVIERAATEVPALRDAFTQGAAARTELVTRRDREFLPLFPVFDQALEAATSNLQFTEASDRRDEMRDILSTYFGAVNEARVSVQRYMLTDDPQAATRTRRAVAQSRVHARRLLAGADESLRADFRRLTEAGDALVREAEALMTLSTRVVEIRGQVITPVRERLLAATTELDRELSQLAAQEGANAAAAMAAAERSVWVIGAVVALMLLIASFITSRLIGTPLRRLAVAVRRIAAGDTAEAVPDQGRRDEIGQIASALEELRGSVATAFAREQMVEQLAMGVIVADAQDEFRITYMNPEAEALLKRIEQFLPMKVEELRGQSVDVFHRNPAHQRAILSDPSRLPHRARITVGGEVLDLKISAIRGRDGSYVGPMLMWYMATAQARLADEFEAEVGGVISRVAAAVDQMQANAQALTGVADVSGREAEAVAEASGRAGADVQAVAASAEELAASVAEITRQVAEGAEVARAAAAEAQATDGTVQGLAQAAARIGDVVRLISDIAAQTNLLALNATIEAARAGEAGKGFAVVASEVKNLAAQTAKATDEIAAQIGGVQGTTQEAVSALRSISATIERMNEVTAAIAAAVEEQGAATREIARSAALVAESTGSVARRIEDVRSAAGETGRSAGEMLSAAGDLSAQASALKEKSAAFLNQVRSA